MNKNWLEWTVFGVSAALILAMASWLVYDWRTPKTDRPLLRIELGEPISDGDVHSVPVTMRNEGDVTAESVTVLVTLTARGGKEEQAELQVPFIPRRSVRNGWVHFHSDPTAAVSLAPRVSGYEVP
ncbi:MAG TPA: hypothetical protein VM328_13765 [Fimbriimonadaceae bacterium]|nr:hypothetical protein [Fimbriimonadaceae bacterium]